MERQLHHNSRTSERIERFWSHSWHGGAMNKILTLLVLYNSQIAVCLGSAASLLMTFLFSMGFLPGLSRVTSVPEYQFSSWSLGSGGLTSLLCRCFFYRFEKVSWLLAETAFGEPTKQPLSIFLLGSFSLFCPVVWRQHCLKAWEWCKVSLSACWALFCGDHSNWSFLIVFALVKAILCWRRRPS